METIISKPAKKIMELFRRNYLTKIHLREICRKTGLNENSASIILNKLTNENILDFEKRGNMKDYFLKNNKKIHALLGLFDSKDFEDLPEIRKKAINIFFDQLNEKPLIVILFGSTAKGNFSKESDIDLFLIVNRKINTKSAKDYSESQTGIEINDFQMSFKDFELELKLKENKVLQSAIDSGYPIMNSELFYGRILK